MQELSTRERRPVLHRGPVGCKRRTGWGFRAALGFASIVGLAGCSTTILSPIGPVADGERTILLDSLAIMLAIVVPTIIAVLMVAWWFRASNDKAVYRPTWSYSGRLELIVWSIPALIVMFLGGIAWISSHELDPKQPMKSQVRPIDVDVVALDWKWLFIYPAQNLASVNRIVVPVGAPLRLHITSASVLNVFFVPRLGSEIYAMSGMTNELNLLASQPGVFPGLSAHFSGDGFAGMRFDFQAVSPDQFNAWATGARTTGPGLDDASYRTLLKQSQNVAPFTYRTVRPGLFDDIVRQALPSGEGPPTPPSSLPTVTPAARRT